MRSVVLLLIASCAPASGANAPIAAAYEDFEALCNAEVRSGAVSVFPFSDKASTLDTWIRANVTDVGVRNIYFQKLPQTPTPEQAAMLRGEADTHGVSRCALADYVIFTNGLSYEAFSLDQCINACVQRNTGSLADIEGACSRGCGGDL